MSKVKTKWIEDGAVTKAKLNSDVAGPGISGGAGTAIQLNITTLALEATVDDADLIVLYDDSVFGHRKMSRVNFLAGLGWPFNGDVNSVHPTDPHADYSTISAAIAGSSSGDCILVAPATYNESFTVNKGLYFVGLGDVTVSQTLTNSAIVQSATSELCVFENFTFDLTHDGADNNWVFLWGSTGGKLILRDCTINGDTGASATAGIMHAVDTDGGGSTAEIRLENCIVSVDDSQSVLAAANVRAITVDGTVSLVNTTVTDPPTNGDGAVIVNESGDALWLIGSRIESIVKVTGAPAGSVHLVSSRVASWSSEIDDDDADTITSWDNYGMVTTDGRTNIYKLPLRSLTADVNTPTDGDMWYRSDTDALHARRNGVTETVLMASDGDVDAIHDDVSAEINAVTEKATPADADVVLIEDSAASWAKKKVQLSNIPADDSDAIHDNVAAEISAVTEKATPVSADLLLMEDSAAANAKKRLQIGNLLDNTLVNDQDALHDNVSGEINAVTEKTSPVGADVLLLEDSAASYAKKRVQITNLPGGDDPDAIHDNVSSEISAITEKATPVSADLLLIEDSAASNAKKKVQVGNLPGGGNVYDTYRWVVNGKPAVQAEIDGAWIVPRAGTITRVTLYRRKSGSSSSTIVDVHKNGTTIYTTQANRPTVTAAGGDDQIDATTDMDVTSLAQDDRLEVDIDQVEPGNMQDISVVMEVQYT